MANTTTGARALVDALLREGVDHVFGIPGTQNLAVIDALRDTPQIRFILTRHEQGAAFMAYGFARAAGRPGVVTATEGPGVTNLATAIGAAYRGLVPVISVCGVQESSMRERDATQDMDQVTFMRPITKWAYSIPNVHKVQESVRRAFRVALTEPQGPAHIEAASEILLEQTQTEAIEQFIKERRKQLISQSLQYIGNSKYLSKINKESYYYVETLKNYKEIFSDKKKTEETALTILNKIPAFTKFVQQNSMLARLFGSPSSGGATPSLAGLQTRTSVNALIQNQIAAGGPNARQQIMENMQAAQNELSKLKDKVLKAGGGSSDAEIPDFKPRQTKTQTFKQRLEFGNNFQFAKNNSLVPATADLGLSLGYKLNDRSVIGIGASYKMGMGSIQHISITHQGIGLRSFVDWKLKKQFYLSGGYEMNYNAAFKNIQQLQNYGTWQNAGLVGLSKKINVKTKWTKGTKLSLLYDMLSRQHVPVSQPVVFRVGYNF